MKNKTFEKLTLTEKDFEVLSYYILIATKRLVQREFEARHVQSAADFPGKQVD